MLQKIRATLAGFALWGAVVFPALPVRAQNQGGSPPPQPQKTVQNQIEFDLYNSALKDLGAKNFTKAIADLDTWKQQFPNSSFQAEREVYRIQAYAGANQPAKALDTAAQLINRGLPQIFSDPTTGLQDIVRVLFATVVAAQQIPNPTPEEVATAEKAAHMLMDYNTKFEGASDADWAKAREQMQMAAKGALLYLAMKPGTDAMQKQDYATAEADLTKALQEFPESAQIAYQLGASEVAQQAKDPAKVSAGIYEIARAVALDPAKGGLADPRARAEVDAYLKRIYAAWHGSDQGLDQLKQQAVASPSPPAGFHIKTSSDIASEKEAEFEKSNPELAMWMRIKSQLTDTNGSQYFEAQLKGTSVTQQLRGTLVEAKPACHSKELIVAVPVPASDAPAAGASVASAQPALSREITLKLDAPLSGKPDLNSEFRWSGAVPTEFIKEPFMLTMTVEKEQLEGLKVTPCTVAPARRRTPAKKN